MVRKGNLAKFISTIISETGKATPIKIDLHAFHIDPYLHEFLEPILINLIFSLPTISWSKREIWPKLKSSNISKTKEATPTKICEHIFDINPYLHEFFEPILIH